MINSLEYEDIRKSIISFLKQDPFYKDFNFDASNVSRIINMLAYSTMYNGWYMKMILDESMADSARTKNALIGHANVRNYLTKFITASKSTINITITPDGTNASSNGIRDVPYIKVGAGQQFKGISKSGKSIYFLNPYDITMLYDSTKDKFISEDFVIVQGQTRSISYNVSELFKKYVINDTQCDEDTIRVFLKSSKNASTKYEYIRKYDFYNTSANENCYYITASTNGVYQIHFGHDIFGREPKIGEYIEIEYIKTNGSEANDTAKFEITLAKNSNTLNTDINFYSSSLIKLTTIEASSGGVNEESIDDLKFAVLNHSRQKSRAVTPEDIKTIIISEFRDVESINVWSGGESEHRLYGKTYISIKPKSGELLTNTSKKIITNMMIEKYGIISRNDLVFVDPYFTDILMRFKFKINRSITSDNASTISAKIEDAVMQYNKLILSKFDINYYDNSLIQYVKENVAGIETSYTISLLKKTILLNYTFGLFTLNFGNTVKSVSSQKFIYGNLECILKNEEQSVYIINNIDNTRVAKIGSADLDKGKVEILIPEFLRLESLDVICEPVYPDVETTEFNIVRIKTIKAEELVKL